VKVDPSFVPQAHSRGGQRAERRRHREIEQQLQQVEKELWRLHRSKLPLLNALRLRDEALGHASKTGDHHEGYACYAPAHIAAATFEVPSRDSQAGHRDHRSYNIATPVHNVEDSALDRGRLLALNGLTECRRGPQVLGSRSKWRKEIVQKNEAQRELEYDTNPVDLIGPVKNES
jgi:hypothetical protein